MGFNSAFKGLKCSHWELTSELRILLGSKLLQESALLCSSEIGGQLRWRKRYFLTGGIAEDGSRGKIIVTGAGIVVEVWVTRFRMWEVNGTGLGTSPLVGFGI